MRLSHNIRAPIALPFVALVAIAPIALLFVIVVRLARSSVNPFDFLLTMVAPAAAAELERLRSKGLKDILATVAHARLF
jgi:hypothetical protein